MFGRTDDSSRRTERWFGQTTHFSRRTNGFSGGTDRSSGGTEGFFGQTAPSVRPDGASVRRGGGTARVTHTPATDSTPLKTPATPEQRSYTVVAVIADAEVGVRSAVTTVLVK